LAPIVFLIMYMGCNVFFIAYNTFVSVYNAGVVAVGILRPIFS